MLVRYLAYLLAYFIRYNKAATESDLTWMSHLDDEKYISQVTIPGTHDTAANFRNSHLCSLFCWCQILSIPQQLESGVRFLDIRLNHYHDMLRITHEFIYLNMNFSDVLDDIGEFFKKGPQETIVMRYREEYKDIDCNRSFSDTLQMYLDQYSDLFYFEAVVPQLKDVRGKIILINTGGGLCNNGSQGLCKRSESNPLGAWTDATDADDWTPDCNPRKRGSCDQYIASLKQNMLTANNASSNPPNEQLFYFTYTSANNGHKIAGPISYARKVNPEIKQFLGSLEAPMSLGCVNMDFMNVQLARMIYGLNFVSLDSWEQNAVQEMEAVLARMKNV